MKTTKEMIEVMQAFERGEQIQFQEKSDCSEYITLYSLVPSWNWYLYNYRVKPKTKTVKLHWVVFEKNGKIYTSSPLSLASHREFVRDVVDAGAEILRTYCETFEVPLED